MSIISKCNGCGATSLGGVLSHMPSCPAADTPIMQGNIMPSTTITFDRPEDQLKFAQSLANGKASTDVSNELRTYSQVRQSTDPLDRLAVYINGLSPHNLWQARAHIRRVTLEAEQEVEQKLWQAIDRCHGVAFYPQGGGGVMIELPNYPDVVNHLAERSDDLLIMLDRIANAKELQEIEGEQ